MTEKPLLGGRLWRAALGLALLFFTLAFVYAGLIALRTLIDGVSI